MEVGDFGQVRPCDPTKWGIQSIHTIIFLHRVHILGGVPHNGGLPGQPVRITGFGGVSFLRVEGAEWQPRFQGFSLEGGREK